MTLARISCLVLCLAAAGCASAQEEPAATSPFTSLTRAAKLTTDPGEPQAFVKATRPADTQFIPASVRHEQREHRILKPDEVKAQEAALTAEAEARQARIGGARPAAAKKPVAPKRKPAPAAE